MDLDGDDSDCGADGDERIEGDGLDTTDGAEGDPNTSDDISNVFEGSDPIEAIDTDDAPTDGLPYEGLPVDTSPDGDFILLDTIIEGEVNEGTPINFDGDDSDELPSDSDDLPPEGIPNELPM